VQEHPGRRAGTWRAAGLSATGPPRWSVKDTSPTGALGAVPCSPRSGKRDRDAVAAWVPPTGADRTAVKRGPPPARPGASPRRRSGCLVEAHVQVLAGMRRLRRGRPPQHLATARATRAGQVDEAPCHDRGMLTTSGRKRFRGGLRGAILPSSLVDTGPGIRRGLPSAE